MQISKVLRYYGGLVKRKIKRMSRKRKQIIVVGASCLVLGLVFGNIFGGIRQKKQAEKQIKKVTAQVQKEEQKKTKAVQKELEQLQQKTGRARRGTAVEYGACEFIASNDGRICSGAYGGGGWI